MNQQDLDFQAKCRGDFIFFCQNILNLEMENYHKEIAILPLHHRYLCIVLPTGHSKSSLFSYAYPLWRIWREKDIEFCIVSSALDQSMKMLAKCQSALESNPFFSKLLPNNRFEMWNKSQLNTSNGNKLYTSAFNSTGRGIHPNFIVYDDLLREGDTPMEQIKDKFWSVFYPRGQIHSCQHIVVGTPFYPNDLYADLENDKQWFVVRKPAVEIDEKGEWGKLLWPERFSYESLKKIEQSMSPIRFSREYLCKPIASGEKLYPLEVMLNCLDDSLDFSYQVTGQTYIGCDFAVSISHSGDYNVFTVVEVKNNIYEKKNKEGTIMVENPVFIRKILRFKGHGQVENIKQLLNQYPNSKVIADSSHVGAEFVRQLRENQISVDAQDFRPANRNMLLMNLRRLMDQQRLVIPNKGDQIFLTNRLLHEASGFEQAKTTAGMETWKSTADHDDVLISLCLAVKDIGSPKKMIQNLFYIAPAESQERI